jgi:hypothetical protein
MSNVGLINLERNRTRVDDQVQCIHDHCCCTSGFSRNQLQSLTPRSPAQWTSRVAGLAYQTTSLYRSLVRLKHRCDLAHVEAIARPRKCCRVWLQNSNVKKFESYPIV